MKEISDFQVKIANLFQEITYVLNEPMSKHTSFRIGGPAKIMAFPTNQEEIAHLLKVSALLDMKPRILGAGTNILAPDGGTNDLVICLKDCLDGMQILEGNRLYVAAGVTMTRAAVFAANHGLGGMEFAHGIPGTVGGGIYMNAGAYGGEISQICVRADVMDFSGNVSVLSNEELLFSYRHSVLETKPGIVLGAVFQLQPADQTQIREKMAELMGKRKHSQPLEYPSAGSAFKRPVGGFAAALIQDAGLKGFRIGGAQVSEKHSGFVINCGGATAEDVKNLLHAVSDRVYEQFSIRLEPEVRIW